MALTEKQIRRLKAIQNEKNVQDKLSSKELQDFNKREKQLLLRNGKFVHDFPKKIVIGFKKGGEPVFA